MLSHGPRPGGRRWVVSPVVAALAVFCGGLVLDVIVSSAPAAQLSESVGVTARMSEFTSGAQGDPGDNDDNIMPSISDDGRFVAFEAEAAYEDEDPGDEGFTNNGHPDIYIHDRDIDGNGIYDEPPVPGSDPEFPTPQVSTEIVTLGAEQPPPPVDDGGVSLRAPHVPPVAGGGFARPAVRVAAPGDPESSNGGSFDADMSGNGNFVAFTSNATNLISPTPDPSSDFDVYRWNRATDTMELVSEDVFDVPAIAAPIFGSAVAPSISSDGQHVAFLNQAGPTRLFVRDFTRESQPFYVEPTLGLANESHIRPHISGDGRHVIFIASGTDDAGTPVRGLAYHDRDPDQDGIFDEVEETETGFLAAELDANGNPIPVPGNPDRQDVSGDGRFVVYDDTVDGQLMLLDRDADGDGNLDLDPEDDTQTTSLELISRTPTGEPADGITHDGAISSDGRYIAYTTTAPNLLGPSPGEECIDFGRSIGERNCQVLLRDRFGPAGEDEVVSVGAGGQYGEGDSYSADVAVTSDGVPFVAFYSAAEDLVSHDEDEEDPGNPDGGAPETDAFVRSFTPPLGGDPNPLDFGTQEVGQPPALMTSTLTNPGPGPIVIESPADDGYQLVRREVTVPGSGFVRDVAGCPGDTVVVGGGAQVVGEGSDDFHTIIQEQGPGAGGVFNSLWFAAVRNTDTVEHTIGIFAVCADPPPGYEVVLEEIPVEAGGFLRDTAVCPAGTVVLAGGASVVREGTGDFRTVLQESAPDTVEEVLGAWVAAVRNTDTVSHTIGLHAVCAAASPAGYEVVSRTVEVPAGGVIREVATCPETAVLGGGVAVSFGEGSNFTVVQESAPATVGSDDVFLVAVRNTAAETRPVDIYAVCATAPSGYQVIRQDFSAVGAGFVRDTVECPAGTVVLGGGAQVVGEDADDFRTVLQESAPGPIDRPGSEWLVALRNEDTVDHTIGIFAACAIAPAGYQVIRQVFEVGSGGFLADSAICPAGTVVLGGGAQVVEPGGVNSRTVLGQSGPGFLGGGGSGEDLWFVDVRNDDDSLHTIGVFAVCADEPTGFQTVSQDATVEPGGVLRQTVDCPAGTLVMGGGAGVVDDGGGFDHHLTTMQESAPSPADGVGPSGWLAVVRNDDAVVHTVFVFAVCASFASGDGPEPVTLVGDDEFTITGETCTPPDRGRLVLAPGDTCEVSMAFEPTADQAYEATLTILYEDNPYISVSTSPEVVRVVGEGGVQADPLFSANPTTLNFGERGIGQVSAPQTVTVSVTAAPSPPAPTTTTAPPSDGPPPSGLPPPSEPPAQVFPPEFTVSGVRVAGLFPSDYRVTGDTCTGRLVTPETPCSVTVVHSPTAVGSRPAVLEFTDTAVGGPTHLIAVEGSGAQPTIIVNPAVSRAGGVVQVTGAQWPPGAQVAITIDFLPAPVNATVGADGTFAQPIVIFQTSTFGPRKVNAAVVGNTTIALTEPESLLVQAPSANPSDFLDR